MRTTPSHSAVRGALASGLLTALLVSPSGAQQGLQSDSALTCSPDTLYEGDTLRLRMSTPHGGQLAIIDPDGTYFFVVYYRPMPEEPSLMPTDEFATRDSLLIATAETKAAPWVSGREQNELIFTVSGRYTALLAHNLETDAPQYPLYRCGVTYVAERRR